MNKKGIYTVTIAVLVMVLVVTGTFVFVGMQKEEEARSFKTDIIEVKNAWQKSSLILDKAVVNALYDFYVNDNGCSPVINVGNIFDFSGKISGYFNDAASKINDSYGGTIVCSSVIPPMPFIPFDVTLTCTKYSPAGTKLIEYAKDFTIAKSGNAILDPGISTLCMVDVMDVQSGYCEINMIPDGHAGNLC